MSWIKPWEKEGSEANREGPLTLKTFTECWNKTGKAKTRNGKSCLVAAAFAADSGRQMKRTCLRAFRFPAAGPGRIRPPSSGDLLVTLGLLTLWGGVNNNFLL